MFLDICPLPGCGDLISALSDTQGGRNVIQAGLNEDVAFAARLNSVNVVPQCDGMTMTIRPFVE
jgi:phosphosulfolactate phosphohydrolase-like enzyme